MDIETCFGDALKRPGPDGHQREEAEAFLREMLEKGPVAAQEVSRRSTMAGFSMSTLRRAKQRLRVISERRETTGAWYWRLPMLEELQPPAQAE